MPVEIDRFVDVVERCTALGLGAPDGLSFLPRNLATATSRGDLLHESAVMTLRVLFRQGGVTEDRVDRDGIRIPVIQENAADLLLPTLCVGSLLMSDNPNAVNIALNIIASYAVDFFKGLGGNRGVKFSIVIKEDSGGLYKHYKYSGSPEGIKELTKLIGRIDDGKAR